MHSVEIPQIESPRETITPKEAVKICIGNANEIGNSLEISVAGLTMNDVIEYKNEITTKCFGNLDYKNMKLFPEKWLLDNVVETHYTEKELCIDTYVIVHIVDDAFYGEHSRRCRSMNGRMLYREEVRAFRADIITNGKKILTKGKNKSVGFTLGTWAPGGNESAALLKDLCRFVIINEVNKYGNNSNSEEIKDMMNPCLVETNYNLCIIPAYTDFTLYTSLVKYDTHYFLKSRNTTFILEGEESSFVELNQGTWILRSKIHREFCSLRGVTLPVGRRLWETGKAKKEKLMFTKCKEHQFGCSSGQCFPKSTRCNGIVECEDESDEEKCRLIEKNKGYFITRVPPPIRNESVFKIKYFVSAYSMADINSVDGIAIVDLFISFLWRDPRLTFWNPVKNEELDCNKIWSPVMAMSDGCNSGFQVSFKKYRSSCFINSTFSDYDPIMKFSLTDPYMGKYSIFLNDFFFAKINHNYSLTSVANSCFSFFYLNNSKVTFG